MDLQSPLIDYDEFRRVLLEQDDYILTTHVNPDADAIGSTMALYLYLTSLNKRVSIINYSATPYNLTFLDPQGVIQVYRPELHNKLIAESKTIVALDFNTFDRTVKMRQHFENSPAIKICIDHHQNPDQIFNHLFSDILSCATGHILYNLFKTMPNNVFTEEIAENLYSAIMTDTGSFRYERTTPEVHLIAAHLLEIGVNPNDLYDKIYDQNKFSKLKLLGQCIAGIELYGDGIVSVMKIRADMVRESESTEEDTDGYVRHCMSIEGVMLGLMFVELPEGFKVSVRSKSTLSAGDFARSYGGGGHLNAAGIRIRDRQFEEMVDEIIANAVNFATQWKKGN